MRKSKKEVIFYGKKGNMFLDSAKELKKTSALAVCAMLAALALILNSGLRLISGPYVKIGFSGSRTSLWTICSDRFPAACLQVCWIW